MRFSTYFASFCFLPESLDFALHQNKNHIFFPPEKLILCFSDLYAGRPRFYAVSKIRSHSFSAKKEILVFFRKFSQANVWSCAFWYFWIALLFYKTRIWFFFGNFIFLQENAAFTIFGLVYFILYRVKKRSNFLIAIVCHLVRILFFPDL